MSNYNVSGNIKRGDITIIISIFRENSVNDAELLRNDDKVNIGCERF